jgi:hypothetical protein
LLSISSFFYSFDEFTDLYRLIDKIPNSFSNKDIKNNYLDIELLENGIRFNYFAKLFDNVDSFVKISEITFVKLEN